MEVEDIDLKALMENETGNKFDRHSTIICPFHLEKSPSMKVKFFSDANKEKYKCFGCGEVGDALDFITKFKNMDYIEARKHLGLTVEKSITEELKDKVESFINWELGKYRKGQELQGLFPFMDADNKLAYFKGKFLDHEDNKKKCGYYHLEGEKVVANRGVDEIPYNLHRTIEAIKKGKTVIICEGEKDANMVNSTLRNEPYQATSIKGVIDNIQMLEYANIFVCSDTGKGGDIYKWSIYKKLFATSKVFKFITLSGIKDLGDNKDVTDWLEVGHTKGDLLQAFKRSLDLKNKYELQQDFGGIYKSILKEVEGAQVFTKSYISNFQLLEATRINFVDREQEGVKIVLKSCTGATMERIDIATVFDDVKTFKGFLGSLDLSFTGSIGDLTNLKIWINSYFAIDSEERYTGVKFINKDNVRMLVTNDGAIAKGKINTSMKSDEGTEVNITKVEEITADELRETMKNLFTFATFGKTFSIIGSIISFLMTDQMVDLKIKNHHLNMVGESGSGKSTILENVIAPILNYPKNDIKSVGLITPFALIKNLSDGNYPILFDEYKPSSLDKFKNLKLSETLRNLYDRSTVSRSDKSFKNRNFQLNRPLILAGEESYPNSEKPLIERSCIVYLSKIEREAKHTANMKWLIENEELLNKLGKSLINIVLELSSADYQIIRSVVAIDIDKMKDRPLNTCINICSGIEVFNLLLKKLKLKQISNYTKTVVDNIKEEVLDNKEEASSQVEMMLIQYNSMIEDGRAHDVDNVIIRNGEGLFIKSSEMINQINEYVRSVNSTWVPLDLKDFRKQAMKAGYLSGKGDKSIYSKSLVKLIRYDTCDVERFRRLEINSIISQEAEDVTGMDNVIPFKDSSNKKEIMDSKTKGAKLDGL